MRACSGSPSHALSDRRVEKLRLTVRTERKLQHCGSPHSSSSGRADGFSSYRRLPQPDQKNGEKKKKQKRSGDGNKGPKGKIQNPEKYQDKQNETDQKGYKRRRINGAVQKNIGVPSAFRTPVFSLRFEHPSVEKPDFLAAERAGRPAQFFHDSFLPFLSSVPRPTRCERGKHPSRLVQPWDRLSINPVLFSSVVEEICVM